MPKERFFINCSLKEGERVVLEGNEQHHLANVARLKAGNSCELVNGRGQLADAEIEKVAKREACLAIKCVHLQSRPSYSLILAQAAPRLNRLDTIIEKATELGATAIFLFAAERSERKELSSSQLARASHVAIAALKQCGRLYLPAIEWKAPLSMWNVLDCPGYFGDVRKEAPLLLAVAEAKDALFFTGPEAGFTEREINVLLALGAKGVKLHANILRTDTASICALSLLHHHLLLS